MGSHSILVINSKGGVGKSTLCSNLASYYASQGFATALSDFDRQMSGVRWLERRDPELPTIQGITGWEYRDTHAFDWIIMDPPAQVERKEVAHLVNRADVVIVPVLPSPIDMYAAADFIRDLMIYGKIRTTDKPIAVVANRARTNTAIYEQLKRFLASLKLPFVASLRDSQNYIHASMRGIGVFEMNPDMVSLDIAQWRPLLEWIDRSIARPLPNVGARSAGQRPPIRAVPI